jgi:hypothetical protein
MAGRGESRRHKALATFVAYRTFFYQPRKPSGLALFIRWQASSAVTGTPFSSCLFPTNISGPPRSAEAGGEGAKNSISYVKTEVALIHAKADENCQPPKNRNAFC